jgi:myosin heavy subunit
MGNVEFGFVGDDMPRPSADSRDFITSVARLLGVDLAVLVNAVTKKKQIIGNEVLESNLTIEQVYQARDSLCKHLYGSVFSWIV